MVKSALVETFRDERGHVDARARNEDDARAGHLAAMLTGGIQGSEGAAKKALEKLTALERGETEEIFIGGNVYEMTVTKDGAELELNVFPDDPPTQFTTDEVKDAVQDWFDLLRKV